MSLANIQGKLSRAEMKNIMAGSGSGVADLGWGTCCINGDCGGEGCRQWISCNGTFTAC